MLLDSMGLGKTVTMGSTLPADAPTLIVAPKAVLRVWRRELAKWRPDLTTRLVDGTPWERARAIETAGPGDVVLIRYSLLERHSYLERYGPTKKQGSPGALNRSWGAVVLDEAQAVVNPKAKVTRAAWAIRASSERAYVMTGTPIVNRPSDFWSLLHFARPDIWTSRNAYLKRYVDWEFGRFGGIDEHGIKPGMLETWTRETGLFWLARTAEDVGLELPPVTWEYREVEPDRAYAKAKEEWLLEFDAKPDEALGEALLRMIRLRQLTAASLELQDDGTVRMAEPSAKLDELDAVLAQTDEPIIAVSDSRQLLTLAERRYGDDCAVIAGGRDDLHRWPGKTRLLLLSPRVGGAGLTLNEARLMVFLDRPWSSVLFNQTLKRIHRIGQERPVTYIDIIARGTVDRQVGAVLKKKEQLLEQTLSNRHMLRKVVANDDEDGDEADT